MSALAPAADLSFALKPLPPAGELEAAWRRLDRTGGHSFFASWTWMGTLLRLLPSLPSLLEARRDGAVVGLALVWRRQAKLRRLLPVRQLWLNATGEAEHDCIFIEHNGLATTEADPWPALLEWFAAADADELATPGIDAPAAAPDLIQTGHGDRAWRLPLKEVVPQGLEALLSRNARQQLRRSRRAYEGPLTLDVAGDEATALAYFEGLKDLHIQSWNRRGRRHAFAVPFFEVFHRALISAGVAEGVVDLMRITSGEGVLGYLYNFRRNGTVYAYQSGFDDMDPALRPGYVCHALAIVHYATAGLAYYDFLAGSNRLKETFATEQYEMYWRHYRKPKAGFRAEALARTAVEFLRRVRN